MKQYCVYILSSKTKVLYIGVTSNLVKRNWEHKNEVVDGFTKKYKCKFLVYLEQTEDAISAFEREKQLKRWNRKKKIQLINNLNPEWRDLSEEIC